MDLHLPSLALAVSPTYLPTYLPTPSIPFHFESAYATCNGGQEPAFTNFTPTFAETLDYIFYANNPFHPQRKIGFDTQPPLSQRGLDVVRVRKLPSREVVSRHVALPSPRFPSDHLPVLVDFTW